MMKDRDISREVKKNAIHNGEKRKLASGSVQVKRFKSNSMGRYDKESIKYGDDKRGKKTFHEKKPNENNGIAESIQRSKKLWEKLRRKSHVPLEDRRKYVDELYQIITGHIKDFVFKHDAVRVIQCALKYASRDQRALILDELKDSIVMLAESRYSKFLLAKLFGLGNAETREYIISKLRGHIIHLINHPEASWILDDIYRDGATPMQKAVMLLEWYGPEFSIFRDIDRKREALSLESILKENPEKRRPIMQNLLKYTNRLVQKKMTGFTMLHDAMLQYLLNVGDDISEFIVMLTCDEEHDLLRNLAFTEPGSRIVNLAIARGNANERKHLLKAYKGLIGALAHDRYGYSILTTSIDVVDDTKFLAKFLYGELLGKCADEESKKVVELSMHEIARIVMLYPMAGAAKWLVGPSKEDQFREYREASRKSSKKDPERRRMEIIKYLSPFMIRTIEREVKELIKTSFGCQVITEVLLSGIGTKTEACKVIAQLAQGDPAIEENHIAHDLSATRMLKVLIQNGRYDSQLGKVTQQGDDMKFAELIWSCIRENISGWIESRGVYIILALLERQDWPERNDLLEILYKNRSKIETISKGVNGKNGENKLTGCEGLKLVLNKLDAE